MNYYFIADIHLSNRNLEIQNAFNRFLESILTDCQRLYILGDLFDYWISDTEVPECYLRALHKLHSLSKQGVDIFFIAGNRDFLLTEDFLKRYGITLLDEPVYLSPPNQSTDSLCLMHGDSLCTYDLGYQVFKKIIRAPWMVHKIRSMPEHEKIAFAGRLRAVSRFINKILYSKNPTKISKAAIKKIIGNNAVSTLIHGHIHAPEVHAEDCLQQPLKRIVLGDWGNKFNVVKISSDTCYRFSWI